MDSRAASAHWSWLLNSQDFPEPIIKQRYYEKLKYIKLQLYKLLLEIIRVYYLSIKDSTENYSLPNFVTVFYYVFCAFCVLTLCLASPPDCATVMKECRLMEDSQNFANKIPRTPTPLTSELFLSISQHLLPAGASQGDLLYFLKLSLHLQLLLLMCGLWAYQCKVARDQKYP